MSHGGDGAGAKRLVTEKFGPNAAKYATSEVHAKGASLERLVALVEPQPSWRALDIATAAGHTAFAFAPHLAEVVASDLTPEMLGVAADLAAERGISNVTFELADAENLPFDDASFDLVTSRIAPHHFPHPERFIAESFRVLRPGGTFALVDNVVPMDDAVADFANAWEKRRDPSHVRALSMQEWLDLLRDVHAEIVATETALKKMTFTPWAERMNVSTQDQALLLEELRAAGPAIHDFLRPDFDSKAVGPGDGAVFYLTEGLIVARRVA